MPQACRPARQVLWPGLCAVPLWLGPWMLDAAPPAGLQVTRPASEIAGSTLRISPNGDSAVSGTVKATFDFVDAAFDGGIAQIHLAAPATAVQAQLRVDDQLVVQLASGPTATVVFGAGRRLTLVVQALDAAPQGWQVLVRGLQFDQQGWRLAYAHNSAGLRARASAPDRVELSADPDWAELGWPVAGTVAATRVISGQTARGVLASTLPAQGLDALVTLDNVPQFAAVPGAFALNLGGTRRLALVLHAEAEQPADASWRVQVRDLQVDTQPEDSGCAARGAATPPDWMALALSVALVARWRYRQGRCAP